MPWQICHDDGSSVVVQYLESKVIQGYLGSFCSLKIHCALCMLQWSQSWMFYNICHYDVTLLIASLKVFWNLRSVVGTCHHCFLDSETEIIVELFEKSWRSLHRLLVLEPKWKHTIKMFFSGYSMPHTYNKWDIVLYCTYRCMNFA